MQTFEVFLTGTSPGKGSREVINCQRRTLQATLYTVHEIQEGSRQAIGYQVIFSLGRALSTDVRQKQEAACGHPVSFT